MRRLLIAALFLGGLINLQGQSLTKFSVHADPQFAWFNSDDINVTPDGAIFNVQMGLQMDRFFDNNYAFKLGIGINNVGGNLLYSDSVQFVTKSDTMYALPGQRLRQNIQYLDLPIGLKLKTEELGYATFFLELGFNPMFNINAKATSKDDVFNKVNIREDTRLFSLGYHAGIGVEYRLGGSTAAIGGIRWSSGLTDVTKNDDANVNISALSIHVGLLF